MKLCLSVALVTLLLYCCVLADDIAQQCSDEHCSSSSNRVAVFSSTVDAFYLFFVPITSLLWKIQDFTPVLQVATHAVDPAYVTYTLEKCKEVGALVYEMHAPPGVDKEWEISAVQVARLYGFMLPLQELGPDPYIITSDADMWPVSPTHFKEQVERNAKELHLLYANAYPPPPGRSLPVMYPICYVGAHASTWKELMKPSSTNNFTQEVTVQLENGAHVYKDSWYIGTKDSSPRWYYDQILLGQRVASWGGCPDKCYLGIRSPRVDRIDRGWWNFRGPQDLPGKIDCHVLRPGTDDTAWSKLHVLLAALLDEQQLSWVDEYRAGFLRLYSTDNEQ